MTKAKEVHVEDLLGRHVIDSNGKRAGKVEELLASKKGSHWEVDEFILGTGGLLERFSAWDVGSVLFRILRGGRAIVGYRVPWETMDLSQPNKPKLRCPREDLKSIEHRERHG